MAGNITCSLPVPFHLTILYIKDYNFSMNLPNILTALRIILSPFFMFFFFLPIWAGQSWNALSAAVCIFLFTVIEFSDLFDGMVARKYGQVSDFGKIFDPFADVFSRLTYFLCFVGIHFMPVFVFAIILYREVTILFCRTMMMKQGIVMGARMGGKVKACAYAGAGISGLLYVMLQRLDIFSQLIKPLSAVAQFFFILSAAAALLSLADYIIFIRKTLRK